jgi:hypothetical protein
VSGSERLDTGPGVSMPSSGATSGSGATSYSAAEPDDVTVENSSVGEIVGKLAGDFSRLMRAEIALAKAEAKEEAREAGKGIGLFAGAGYAGHLLLLFGSLAVMFGLGAWMPLGWAALIVGVVWGIVALVLYTRGRSSLKRATATPPMTETVETLKEDAQWAKRPRG